MTEIRHATPNSKGELIFLHLDLADLSTIKSTVDEFLSQQSRLDVLFNNAGVMDPPAGSKTAQGYELQLGVNCIGTFMFTKLLTPILASTAKSAKSSGSVRVVWVSSSAADVLSPWGGVPVESLDNYHNSWAAPGPMKYGVSKAGSYYYGTEFAKRYTAATGIVSVPLNPGNLDSELYRHQPWPIRLFMRTFILHPVILGAYTELFAGLSPEVTVEKSGSWGKFAHTCRPDETWTDTGATPSWTLGQVLRRAKGSRCWFKDAGGRWQGQSAKVLGLD